MVGRAVSHDRVLDLLGSGGMGTVYRPEDTRLGRPVALKFLPADLTRDRHALDRFQREARTASALNHPHICTLFGVGEHPSTGSGQAALYLVMDHLTGETLAQRLEKGPLPLEQALTIATEIGDAVAAAHRQRHRSS